ncbi:calcium-binding protein [Falsiruegeria mediterranea]|uniref:Bifunctional hemolysin/adenylate cyclase n=1 Tax=Falsiruegeria mediterranea M17 TaxID=1200281 RepID=A0A2R8CEZ9_9RHOB|nr:calcium-binding protein [Falsiruegeria mediterranea]SPJ30970.1 Bifunctional hemolysin/adenylate cyclase [Falsiruegeria mediterranea M17]
MPDTPISWGPSYLAPGISNGSQFDPDFALLASGNYVITWTTDDQTSPTQGAGLNITGRRFDQLGRVLDDTAWPGNHLPLDEFSSATSNGSVAALPFDGLIVVYEATSGSTVQLKLAEHIQDGTDFGQDSSSLRVDGSVHTPSFGNPDIDVQYSAQTGFTTALIVYERVAQDNADDVDVLARTYVAETDAYSAEFEIFDLVGTAVHSPKVLALGSGNFAVLGEHVVNGVTEGLITILQPDGTVVAATSSVSNTRINGRDDTDFALTRLDVGFAVAWQAETGTDREIHIQKYTDAGLTHGDLIKISTDGIDTFTSPALAQLPNNHLIVVYETNGQLVLQRFDDTGLAVGNEVILDASSATNPAIQSLGDGRVVVVWEQLGDVRTQMFDTRDQTSFGFFEQNWQIGTFQDDIILASVQADFMEVHGLSGNDTITATGGPKLYDGGDGDDVITAFNNLGPDNLPGQDAYIGGAGQDLIDLSRLTANGHVIDLEAGLGWLNSSPQTTHVLSGFEHLIGTPQSDNITGSAEANNLSSGEGYDWIIPGRGNDTVDGGVGRDMVSYSDVTEVAGRGTNFMLDLDLGAGTANIFGGEVDQLISIERATGSIFADVMRGSDGNDEMRGLGDYDWFIATAGNDTLDGGNGQDMITFLEASSSGAPVVETVFSATGAPPMGAAVGGVTLNLSDPTQSTGLALGLTLNSVERVTGSSHQDVFYGDAQQNDFRGLGGYDWFVGSTGGRERYFGGDGLDTVTYFQSTSGVAASLRNGAGLSGGQETGYGSAGDAVRDLYFEIENLVGTNFDDSLTGNNERNQLSGLDGDDFLFGYGGNDYMKGGAGNDTLNGGAGSDFAIFDGNRADYTITRSSTTDVTVTGAAGTDSLISVEYFQFDDETANIWQFAIA